MVSTETSKRTTLTKLQQNNRALAPTNMEDLLFFIPFYFNLCVLD